MRMTLSAISCVNFDDDEAMGCCLFPSHVYFMHMYHFIFIFIFWWLNVGFSSLFLQFGCYNCELMAKEKGTKYPLGPEILFRFQNSLELCNVVSPESFVPSFFLVVGYIHFARCPQNT